MKVLKITFLIFVGMICLNGRMDVSATITLQSQINATPEGGTLHLKKGAYYEPIVLKRDIQVIGEKGVIFKSCYSPNIITIKGENVQLKGVRVESCEEDRSTSAIFVTGRNHRLEDIQIESEIIGIMLQNAKNSVFKNNKISGKALIKLLIYGNHLETHLREIKSIMSKTDFIWNIVTKINSFVIR